MISRSFQKPATVREALRAYERWAPDLSDRTIQRMGHDVNRALKVWGEDTAPEEITTDHFVDLRRLVVTGELAVSTVENTIATVWTLLRFLSDVGMLDHVPSKGRVLRRPAPELLIPSLEEFGAMYAAADLARWPRLCHDRPHWWRSFLALAYFSGLRLGDLLAFRWEWIRDDGAIEVVAEKTRKRHVIPMHRVLVRHLREIPRVHARVFVAAKSSLKCLRREMHRMSEPHGITAQHIRRLAINEWERARPGCGLLIQGSGFKGSARHYLDPQVQLWEAVEKLRVPAEMLARPDEQLRLF